MAERRFHAPIRKVVRLREWKTMGFKNIRFDDEPDGCELGMTDAEILEWCRRAWDKTSPCDRRSSESFWRQAGRIGFKGVLKAAQWRINQRMRDDPMPTPPVWRIRMALWRARPEDGDVLKWLFGTD